MHNYQSMTQIRDQFSFFISSIFRYFFFFYFIRALGARCTAVGGIEFETIILLARTERMYYMRVIMLLDL